MIIHCVDLHWYSLANSPSLPLSVSEFQTLSYEQCTMKYKVTSDGVSDLNPPYLRALCKVTFVCVHSAM